MANDKIQFEDGDNVNKPRYDITKEGKFKKLRWAKPMAATPAPPAGSPAARQLERNAARDAAKKS